MLPEELSDRVAAGKLLASRAEPYLSSALYALTVREAPDSDTVAADRWWRVYVDPNISADWTATQWATVLRAEARRLLLDHPARADRVIDSEDPRSAARFAIASDLIVATDTSRSGDADWPRPVDTLDSIPGASAGMAVEEVYELMALQEIDLADSAHGSAADGIRRSWEAPDADEDGQALGEEQARMCRRKVAKEIGKDQSADSPALEAWVAALNKPALDWRRQLDSHVRAATGRAAGRRDYTFSRPSRRRSPVSGGARTIMPGMDAPAPPRVAVVRDTSGSMTQGDDLIAQATAEIDGMLTSRARVTLIDTDSEARQAREVRHSTAARTSEGGGSTDMGAGLQAAGQLRPRPHLVVVLTDGETDWPERNPVRNAPVLVCLLGAKASRESGKVPSWADVLVLEGAGR